MVGYIFPQLIFSLLWLSFELFRLITAIWAKFEEFACFDLRYSVHVPICETIKP